ncbi:unnamed protein product [Boreogadus saida]
MSVGGRSTGNSGDYRYVRDFTSSCPGQSPGHSPTPFLCSGIVWEVFHQNEVVRGASYMGNSRPDNHLASVQRASKVTVGVTSAMSLQLDLQWALP